MKKHVTSSEEKRSERTFRETLPDGSVRVKTIVEKTLPDGRKLTEETTSIEQPSRSRDDASSLASPARTSQVSGQRQFKLPNVFSSFARPRESGATTQGSPEKLISLAEFRHDLLRLHNVKRSQHNAPNLVISEELNSVAQQWAEHLAQRAYLQHRPNSDYGENIFMGYNSSRNIAPSEVIEQWYSEVNGYSYTSNQPSSSSGHFTQMVWKNSKEVGFGRGIAANGSVYVVANYSPAGNVNGRYKENVGPPVRNK